VAGAGPPLFKRGGAAHLDRTAKPVSSYLHLREQGEAEMGGAGWRRARPSYWAGRARRPGGGSGAQSVAPGPTAPGIS
jgi:hypothetical protein